MRSLLRITTLLAFTLIAAGSAAAQTGPAHGPSDFAKYPVDGVYKGKLGAPDFKGRDKKWNNLRTRIREGIKGGPNFAGRFAMIEIGCGTGCRFVPVADVATGQVFEFPLGGEENYSLNLKYKPTSRLVVAYWISNNRCRTESFTWNGKAFDEFNARDIGSDQVCYAIDVE